MALKNCHTKESLLFAVTKLRNQVWIDVIDNGWGIEKGDHDTGYAMQNLKERLAIAFGAPFGIQVVEVKQGAKIRLILPLLLNSQENL